MNTTLRSTIQLLRFHFSFLLMPVYWFALSRVENIHWNKAVLIFVILHLLVYPASNGYNSYMDRDTSPIGGVAHPLQPTKQLLYVTSVMNIMALALSFFISFFFAVGIFLYILASLAYSYRGIRLKKYPYTGYLTVILFQGALTFYLVYHGSGGSSDPLPFWGMLASALLIGGAYPITQVYQHEADKNDGVTTLSYLLGIKGTFFFTGIVYAFAFLVLGWMYYLHEPGSFIILLCCMLPVILYFSAWFARVIKNKSQANYKNTMRMNLLASVCTNLGFFILLIIK